METQQGFTLLELMIVVAIIGILAAIAIPEYQFFVAKSQTAESIALLDAARINSEDTISLEGEFPLNKTALTNINTKLMGTFGEITGTANTTANTSSGDIIYKFKTIGANEDLNGKSIWYNRTLTGVWECRTDLNATLAPKMCIPNHTAPTGT